MGEFRIALVVRKIINEDKARLAEAEIALLGHMLPVASRRAEIVDQMESCVRRLAGAIDGNMDVEIDEANRPGKLDLMLPMYDALKQAGHFEAREKANQDVLNAEEQP